MLLLDEPTANLDPDVADYVLNYLKDYSQKKNTTLLFASHNMREVERICDQVVLMRSGKVVSEGTPKEIINYHSKSNLEEVFLKVMRS